MNVRSCCTEYYLLSDKKQLSTLNNIRVLLKSVLIDLRARNFVHAKTSLRERLSLCAQLVEPWPLWLYRLVSIFCFFVDGELSSEHR